MIVKVDFEISNQMNDVFNLAVSISGEKKNEVIERLISTYATEVLQKEIITKNSQNFGENREPLKQSMIKSKAYNRFEGWAKRSHQINHQILKAFFRCERNGVADRNDMRNEFNRLNPDKSSYIFEINLNSMATESGNSHGLAFVLRGDSVSLSDEIKVLSEKYRKDFL